VTAPPPLLPELTCEVCNERPAVGVASIPGMPMSIAWCRECLASGAIPWWAAIAETACIGGLAHAADWWLDIVDATCRHLGRTRDELDAAVTAAINEMEDAQ
jgi:hypothetical protein